MTHLRAAALLLVVPILVGCPFLEERINNPFPSGAHLEDEALAELLGAESVTVYSSELWDEGLDSEATLVTALIPPTGLAPHMHVDSEESILVQQGLAFLYLSGGRRVVLTPGSIFQIPAGEPHRLEVKEAPLVVVVRFHPALTDLDTVLVDEEDVPIAPDGGGLELNTRTGGE